MPFPGVSIYLRWAGLGLVAMLALGSCRRVAPYQQADSSLDGPVPDSARVDLLEPDAGSPVDLLPADLLPADLLPADLLPADLLPADLLPADLACSAPTFPQTDCAKPCTPAADDKDCDGLPNVRDPSLALCQPLLFAEEFAQDPTLRQPPHWTITAPQNVTWSCGKAVIAKGTTLVLADPQLLASNTTGAYLVETRFTLGAAPDPLNWSVGIRVGLTTGNTFTCTVWKDTTYNAGRPPGAHLNIKGCGQDSGTWDTAPQGSGVGANGETYVLQFWYDGKAHCRVWRGNGTLQSESSAFTCSMARPDTFHISVGGRAATLHYVRVFAFPN